MIVPRPNSNQCNNLDRESEKFVLLQIQAEDLPRYDSKLTDNSKVINITLLDINDNAPEFNVKTEYMEVGLWQKSIKRIQRKLFGLFISKHHDFLWLFDPHRSLK